MIKGIIRILFVTLIVPVSSSMAADNSGSWSTKPTWAEGLPSEKNRNTYQERSEWKNKTTPFAPGSHNLSLNIGQVFLLGDLGSDFNDSIGFQLRYTHGVSDIFGFNASISRSSHSDGADNPFSITSGQLGLRTNLSWFDRTIPFVNFGLGFYKPSKHVSAGESISPVLFGLNIGPGVDLLINDMVFFGSTITFNNIFGTTKMTKSAGAQSIGGTFTTFYVHAGVTL